MCRNNLRLAKKGNVSDWMTIEKPAFRNEKSPGFPGLFYMV